MSASGVEVLATWRRGAHALLLTDLHMPEMDGYMHAAAPRAEEVGAVRLPIFALTANDIRNQEVRCRQAGIDGCPSKPVRLAPLKATMESMLLLAATAPSGAIDAGPPADLQVLGDLVGAASSPRAAVLATLMANFSNELRSVDAFLATR
jgi:CheY-like chemotaxis protein